ncbi:hypothetical protein C7437_1011037 [Psychrobacillus insolitus]|uniref:Uncharacterized protein n=1 Tax=Psychrobacillus insolitus TaxID=1461 RepID=A0A2W7MM29_9BACI|nr:hypothetical protein [Psychrobacillus insolitus]PZX07915.1 hypothetical protein C7437_1011037 [Psychrobacillus insolitus]
MEINQELYEKAKVFFDKLVEGLRKIAQAIVKVLDWIKEKSIDLYQFEEEKPLSKRNHHKLDLTRQKMQHQVIECKPRNLIKKIIH